MCKFTACFLLLLSALVLPLNVQAGMAVPYDKAVIPAAPDYTKAENWLAKPAQPGQFPIDVFWVYPTILSDHKRWLMNPADADLQKLAANTIVRQASIFEDCANLYAPYYRQMNMAALGLDEEKQAALMSHGKEDVWAAFQHYLKYENDGRPFILAAHSQGSDLLLMLMREHWGKTGAETLLGAAYLIGWSVTQDDLRANRNLKICEAPDQTGCIVTYNTVAAGRQKVAPTIREGAIVVNPLNWRTNGRLVSAMQNMGARFFDADGTSTRIKNFTSAQVVDGGLVVDPKDPALVTIQSETFPKGVYHPFDYSLFYENLKQNAEYRARLIVDSLDGVILSPAPAN